MSVLGPVVDRNRVPRARDCRDRRLEAVDHGSPNESPRAQYLEDQLLLEVADVDGADRDHGDPSPVHRRPQPAHRRGSVSRSRPSTRPQTHTQPRTRPGTPTTSA